MKNPSLRDFLRQRSFRPDDRVKPDDLGVLVARLLPEGQVECWVYHRPDLTRKEKRWLAQECIRRLESLQVDGLNGPYTWSEFPGGFVQVSLKLMFPDSPMEGRGTS